MSAPSIPNLLSLRGTGNGSGTGRGRGRVRTRAPPPISSAVDTNPDTDTDADRCARHDAAIQATDTDAAVSRLSAVAAGYLDDPYAAYFVFRALDADADDHNKDHDHAGTSLPLPLPTQSQQRLPIINRGTYVRTVAIDAKIRDFLSPCYDNDNDNNNGPSERQIISLGAGTDTRPFRFFAPSADDDDDEQQPFFSQRPRLTYHEVDFAVTSRRKFHTVQSHPVLSRVLTAPETLTPHTWTAKPVCGDGVYYCHGLDLRDLRVDHATNSNSNDGNAELNALRSLLRSDIPTLILSECCLCYLEADAAERVLRYFVAPLVVAGNVTTALIYEPVPLDDAFGRVMVSNLAARGIHIPGMRRHRTPRDQVRRLRDAGFIHAVECHTIDHLWDARVAHADKERVQRLQRLDEEEEWKLLAAHYVVAWGVWRPQNKKHP